MSCIVSVWELEIISGGIFDNKAYVLVNINIMEKLLVLNLKGFEAGTFGTDEEAGQFL